MSTTLIEELEQAASLFENTAGAVGGEMNARIFDLVAGRLRARVGRLKELEREFTEVERFKYDAGYQDALRRLTGPDTSPETPGKKETP